MLTKYSNDSYFITSIAPERRTNKRLYLVPYNIRIQRLNNYKPLNTKIIKILPVAAFLTCRECG